MVSTAAILAAIATLIVCIALPFAPLIALSHRRQRIARPWLFGTLAFIISQLILRIPLIRLVLPTMDWYIRLTLDPIGHGLFLALTAGIFEETARFLMFRHALKRSRRWIDGIAFGFGHGGSEALLITGLTVVNLLVLFIAANTGQLDTLLAGLDGATRAAVRQQIMGAAPLTLALGGLERILAVGVHIGLTLIVLTGFRTGHPWQHLMTAIAVHAAVDAIVAILPRVMPVDALALELIIAAAAAVLVWHAFRARRHFAGAIMEPADPVRKDD